MAFTVATTGGIQGSAVTDHVLNLATYATGDLLIEVLSVEGIPSFTWPSGWTALYAGDTTDSLARVECRYRVATGGEGSSITVTTDVAKQSSYNSYGINGQSGSAPEAGTLVSATTSTPDPPSLTPSWGANDTLWIVLVSWKDATGTSNVSTYPTNYANGFEYVVGGGGNGTGTASARRVSNTATENPGTFAMDENVRSAAQTIAIEPTAALPSPSVNDAATLTEAQTMHMPIHLRMEKLS